MGFHPLLAFITVALFISRQVVALADIVHQLLHQYGGETLAVVLNRTADIADIELALSRNERFKEEVAVIIAAATIAPFWVCAHQVEPQRRQRARIHTVVHAKQADHPERDRTHGHQGADIDRPRQETLADSLLVKPLRQLITQQRQRDGLVVVGIHAFVDDGLPLGFNERHRRFGVIVRQEEIIE